MDIKAAAIQVFVPVLCALFTAVMSYVILWLRKKAQELDLGVWDKAADLIIDELDTAITKFQPLVDEMKSKATDGKLDAEQIAMLKAKAIDYVQTQLAPMGIDVGKTVAAELMSDWVTHLVEARKNAELAVTVPAAAKVLAKPVATLGPK